MRSIWSQPARDPGCTGMRRCIAARPTRTRRAGRVPCNRSPARRHQGRIKSGVGGNVEYDLLTSLAAARIVKPASPKCVAEAEASGAFDVQNGIPTVGQTDAGVESHHS